MRARERAPECERRSLHRAVRAICIFPVLEETRARVPGASGRGRERIDGVVDGIGFRDIYC